MVFLDFAKAFDKVSRNKLLLKFHAIGVNSKLIDSVRAYLNNRIQYVEVSNIPSDTLLVTSDVPQD